MSQVVSKEILDELLALTRESYVMFEKLIEVGIQSGEFREDNTRSYVYCKRIIIRTWSALLRIRL